MLVNWILVNSKRFFGHNSAPRNQIWTRICGNSPHVTPRPLKLVWRSFGAEIMKAKNDHAAMDLRLVGSCTCVTSGCWISGAFAKCLYCRRAHGKRRSCKWRKACKEGSMQAVTVVCCLKCRTRKLPFSINQLVTNFAQQRSLVRTLRMPYKDLKKAL